MIRNLLPRQTRTCQPNDDCFWWYKQGSIPQPNDGTDDDQENRWKDGSDEQIGDEKVGCTINVFWPNDSAWYRGKVTS